MKSLPLIVCGWLVTFLAVPSCSFGKTKVELKDAQGKDVGSVLIWDAGSGVVLKLDLHDLSPGEHAIHFHQVPKCEGPDFKSAGGHFKPGGKKHGFNNPEGHHAGDLRNFMVRADGTTPNAHLQNQEIRLTDGPRSLLTNGAAIVVHAQADDYKTDPSGNSGDRVACGVITK